MAQWIRRTLLCILTAALARAAVTPQRLDEQAQAYHSLERFNGSVLVAQHGTVLLSKGYGMANFEWMAPATADTKFRLGSITKQFTAMAVLLLEQQGKLKVDDAVCKYVDACPEAWKPLTLHHLLTHTSGIANFTGFPDYQKTMAMPSPPAETLKRFRERPLEFAPGSKFSYSNSGYVLLGYVIEKVSGTGYAAYLRQNVFAPLGMNDSGYDDAKALLAHRAAGYNRVPGGVANSEFIDMTIPHAAGSLYSTTLDLMKWDEALKAGKLLSAENHKRYITPVLDRYAYGWFVATKDGVTQISHGGGINGFATMILRVPSEGLLVVTLSNVLPSQAGKLADDLLALARGKAVDKPAYPTEVKLGVETLRPYVGEYELSPQFIITISLEGGQLMTQATGQPSFPLFASSETEFFLKVVEAKIRFEKDGAGKVTGLTLEQGGSKMKAPLRGRQAARPEVRTEVKLNLETLRRYVGEYELSPEFIITMSLDGEQLMTQASGQPQFPIFASSEREFFLKVVEAKVTFETDPAGKVTGLTLEQGGRTMKATRR